jgi:CspA family cold shock protein
MITPQSNEEVSGSAGLDVSSALTRGRVQWFEPRRGYGFVRCEDGSEAFVHFGSIAGWTGRVEPGQEVEFSPIARGAAG